MSKEGLYSTELGTSGERIAFCHGLFGQGRNWMTIAKALVDQFRVTLVDLPNHGRSAWTDQVSYAQMADAVGDLLGGEGEPLTLVGHSMGGKVAMALALQRPELVQRVCVIDIAPVRYQRLSSFANYVRGMRALDLGHLPDRAMAEKQLQRYVPEAVVRGFLLQNLRRDGHGWRWQMNLDLLGNHLDDLADWPDLHADPYPGPALWLAGARSDYITSDYAPAMRDFFPRVRLVTVKQAGHWVHSERPDVVVATLRKFMAA